MGSHYVLLGLLALAAIVMAARRPTDVRDRVATPEEQRSIVLSLQSLGWPPGEVVKVIARESGWRASAINPTTQAVGLIQFMPATLVKLGFMPQADKRARAVAFAELGPTGQQPFIVAYFRAMPHRWRVPGDTYMALFAPSKLPAPDGAVLYAVGSKGWEQNPSLRSAGNGPITAGSVRARGRVA